MSVIGATNQLATLGGALGYSQGGAPASVLGYQKAAPAATPSAPGFDYGAAYAKALSEQNAIAAQQLAYAKAQNYLPSYDILGNYTKAGTAAAGVVNPLYQQKLSDYLTQEQVNKTRKQEDVTTANKQLDESLANTLQASDIGRTRTTEDVGNNLNQLADQQQQFQADSGTGFDQARTALLRQTGDVGGGLDAQAVANQQTQRNTTEGRQVQAFDVQKQAQNLLKTRTFEDLARSDTLANTQTGEQKQAVQVDLNRYLQDLATQEQGTRNDLESQRLQALYAEQQNQYKNNLAKFYSTLSGVGLKNAISAYGAI